MPAFFHGEFWSLANPELWVGVGLLGLIAIAWFAGGFRQAAAGLDAKAAAIQHNLDEAARLRADAEALLADIRRQKAESEAQGAAMLKEAQEQARLFEAEAKTKLEEQLTRRQQLAERKIASAEAAAVAEVKAAAADLAAQAAEAVLAGRLKGKKSDPLVASAIEQLGAKLQ
jgi:F-type H+-transporting ATPase subunit b